MSKPRIQKGLSYFTRFVRISGVFVVLLVVSNSQILSPTVSARSRAPLATLTFLATDPYASTPKQTPRGQTLWTLEAYNGKLYIGYGDWGANTGPIQIAPYDQATNSFSLEGTSQTQAIENYRALLGTLYAPAIDGHLFGTTNYAKRSPTDASWVDYDPENPPWHTFDMTSLNGTDLWFVGTEGVDAVAWRSLDGGVTWQSAPHTYSYGSTDETYYFIGNYNGKIYLQASPDECTSEVFDGTTWTTGPNLLPGCPHAELTGFRPVDFAGKMVYYDREASRFNGVSGVYVFDGTKVQTLSNTLAISIFNVDGNYLYGATSAGIIYRTTDLENWETLGGGGLANGD